MKYIIKVGDNKYLSGFISTGAFGMSLKPILSESNAAIYNSREEADESAMLVANSCVFELALKKCERGE